MTLKILVVDDSKLVQEMLKDTILRHENVSVDLANNGNEAIEKVNEKNYDLVFLDILMPGRDGFEVMATVKTFSPNTQFVVCSSADPQEIKEKVKELNVRYIIKKPFREEDIQTIISQNIKDDSLEFEEDKDLF